LKLQYQERKRTQVIKLEIMLKIQSDFSYARHVQIQGGEQCEKKRKDTTGLEVRSEEDIVAKDVNLYDYRNETQGKVDFPMHNRRSYLALDCEMVGVGTNGEDSALARVSIVNWFSEVILDTFVKVPEPVTDFRTFVSGIRAQDICSDAAMELSECRERVRKIIKGKILIGHALENDLKVLMIKHPWCDLRDTATHPPYMRETIDAGSKKTFQPRKLRDLAWEELGTVIQVFGNSHNSTEDAIAALELYKRAMHSMDDLIMLQIQLKWSNQVDINNLDSACIPYAASPSKSSKQGRNDYNTRSDSSVPHQARSNVHISDSNTSNQARNDNMSAQEWNGNNKSNLKSVRRNKIQRNVSSNTLVHSKHFQTHQGIQYYRSRSGVIRSSSPESYVRASYLPEVKSPLEVVDPFFNTSGHSSTCKYQNDFSGPVNISYGIYQ